MQDAVSCSVSRLGVTLDSCTSEKLCQPTQQLDCREQKANKKSNEESIRGKRTGNQKRLGWVKAGMQKMVQVKTN